MENEIWRPCKDYEDLYEISNLGRVRSCDKQVWNGLGYYFKEGKIKKLIYRKDGYVTVSLYKNNKGRHIRVHRLVAYAFIDNPNPTDFHDVNHIDCNRSNNNATNLEWCNPLYNYHHSSKLNRMKPPTPRYGENNKWSKPVMTIGIENGAIEIFANISDGLKFLNTENPYSRVSNVFRSIERKGVAYGHRWFLLEK